MEATTLNKAGILINTGGSGMNTIGIGSVGIALPVTSGIDPSINAAINSGSITGSMSVPCSAGDSIPQQHLSLQTQPHQLHIPGTTMSLGSLAVAMGLSGAGTDPNSLAFTSNALASLTARMGLSSVAGSNPGGLLATGNNLMAFPGNAALNLIPGVGLGPGGVSIVDGSGLSMTMAGRVTMQAPSNINVVQASNDLANSNTLSSSQQHHNSGALLQNNIHINTGGSMVNNMGSGASIHSAGTCCGGCRGRVTVKDQCAQTDLSTVIQVKAEERLARSGLMPGARLISHSPGTTVSHANPNSHHGPNFPCSCDFCGRMFAKKEYLRRHVRIHTGERPYKCVICGHSFRRSHHLRCHELTHTGTKPYSCGICGKAFNLSHHLRRHEMTHTGEKPYACTECGKAFTRKQHLDRHYKTHTVLTTPDLTAATFSPVNNVNLSVRADGTLRADGLSSSPISVVSKDDSHSSEDYLTSDEEGKTADSSKPKEGSKKRKGSSPMRLRFPYDYSTKEGMEAEKIANIEIGGMKNLSFPLPHGDAGPSHLPGLPIQTGTILTTPTRGRPRGSKNRGAGSARGKKKADRVQLMDQLTMEMKTERVDVDRNEYGVLKKDDDTIASVYGVKTIANIPQQFMSESVVVRHPLQVASPHVLAHQMSGHSGEKAMTIKQDGSTPGPIQTPTPTPTPDGRGLPLQWQPQQQAGMNPSSGGGSGNDYMSSMSQQLHTPGHTSVVGSSNTNNVSAGDAQQTMHYKPPGTPDQNIQHSWPAPSGWPRISLASESASNSYNQLDTSRFMNIYSASKVMEMRMVDLRDPQNFNTNEWNQGRRDQAQDKGDTRIYNMHQ